MSRARVLVVDDNRSLLELMESILGEVHELVTASDPVAAIGLLRTERFDVVLTDVRMPGASGFDVLAAANRCPEPPTSIVMTGFATIPEAVLAVRQGAFDYVAKPLEADEVALVVARALQHRSRGPAGPVDEATRDRSGAPPDFREAMAAARHGASRDYLVLLMQHFQGNVTHAAKKAGMTRVSLHRLLKKYGVDSSAFKPAR